MSILAFVDNQDLLRMDSTPSNDLHPMSCCTHALCSWSCLHLVSLLVPCIPAGLECCVLVPGLLLSFVSSSQESPLTRCCRVLVGKPALPECPSVGSQWENDDRLFKFPGNLIPLAYRSIWRISNKPARCLQIMILSLPVTLVMSYSDYRAPQFEERSILCMITSSKDPKVFIGFTILFTAEQ